METVFSVKADQIIIMPGKETKSRVNKVDSRHMPGVALNRLMVGQTSVKA